MNQAEIWEDIPGYEGLYQASNLGNIKSYYNKNGKKYLRFSEKRNGYYSVVLVKNKRKWYVGVHVLILMAFSQEKQNGRQVNHIDGNKHNNNIINLEWVTASENRLHSCYILKQTIKPVIQLSKNKKTIIAEYNSIKEASFITGINKTGISMCLRNVIGSAGGYSWEFKNPIHAQRYQNRKFKYKYRVGSN